MSKDVYLSDNWEIFRAFADSYNIIQESRIASENRIRAIVQRMDETEEKRFRLLQFLAGLKKEEKDYLKIAKSFLHEEPIWEEFLSYVTGIGDTLAMKILSYPLLLNKDVTSWWAFAGVTPYSYKAKCENGHKQLVPKDPSVHLQYCKKAVDKKSNAKCNAKILPEAEKVATKRCAGYSFYWNAGFKSLGYIITDCFIKNGKYYRKVYEQFREEGDKKFPDSPKHSLMHARRLTFKLFLSHLHECGCELKGVPYRKPYQFEFLNHKWFISWKEVVEMEIALKGVKIDKKKKAV